jgi:hypothetical protein
VKNLASHVLSLCIKRRWTERMRNWAGLNLMDKILAPHTQNTWKRMAQEKVVPALAAG